MRDRVVVGVELHAAVALKLLKYPPRMHRGWKVRLDYSLDTANLVTR